MPHTDESYEKNTEASRWISTLIGNKRRVAIPIASSLGISLIGVKPIGVFKSGELQFQAIRALAETVPSAAALTMMDLSVEAEAFGSTIIFSDDENPTVSGSIVLTIDDVDALEVPEVGAARTGEYLTAAHLSSRTIADRPTLGGMIGPFSLVGRLFDMNHMMLLTALEPKTVHALLEKATSFLLEYAKAFKSVGCRGLVIAEPAAGLVSPKMCREFSSDYVRRIVDAVQDARFVVVLHNCGNTEKMVGEMLSTGASALHVGNAVDIRTILDQVPKTVPVMGNIDPVNIFRLETPEHVHAATLELLKKTSDHPHFVLSSGCDIPPRTPIENLTAFFLALDEYNDSVAKR